jgi:hypothetical protein
MSRKWQVLERFLWGLWDLMLLRIAKVSLRIDVLDEGIRLVGFQWGTPGKFPAFLFEIMELSAIYKTRVDTE